MGRQSQANGALDSALSKYAHLPGVVGGVREALGAEAQPPMNPNEFPIVAFLFRPTAELFSAWLLSPGRFILHEYAAGGESLTITVPLTRVRRLRLYSSVNSTSLTVELDADKWSLSGDIEHDSVPLDQEVPGGRAGRATLAGALSPTTYTLTAEAPAEVADLKRFARRLSSLLGL